MKARDFRALARQALSGRWGVAVLTGFLAALLGGTMASSGSSGSGGSSVGSSAGEFIQSNGGHYEIPDFVWTALIILARFYRSTRSSALSLAAQSSLATQSSTLP